MPLLTRFLNLFRLGRLRREFADELRFHLERRTEDHLQAGMSRREAERQAAHDVGNTARIMREMQEVRVMKPLVATGAFIAVVACALSVWFAVERSNTATPTRYYQLTDQGITPPSVLREKKPDYPAEAMKAKIQGSVEMRCVVQTTGLCDDVEVAKSLDPMWLDVEAEKAMREWRFTPGTRMGAPVPVMVNVEFRFEVRQRDGS